jgi:hypothetical protein
VQKNDALIIILKYLELTGRGNLWDSGHLKDREGWILGMWTVRMEGGTNSRSCSMVDFGIAGVEPSDSTTKC